MQRDAVFSNCGRYRYVLSRYWDTTLPSIQWIGLNPSTADQHVDDPTIRRIIRFSMDWGFGSLWVCNLFGFRATLPRVLFQSEDPIGPENDWHLMRIASEADARVFCWGNDGRMYGRSTAISKMLASFDCQCMGMNQTGEPAHPLYQRREQNLQPFHSALKLAQHD